MGIDVNDLPHVRSEERGVSSRAVTTPLELMSSPRPTTQALRRTLKQSFGLFSRARASPSSEILRFPRSKEHRSLVFSPAELFQKLRQLFETHNLRRNGSSLEITTTSVELIARLPFCFSKPEGLLPPSEKLVLSSIKGSSANRPSVGFPSR